MSTENVHRAVDRSRFGSGPWDDEPDRAQWRTDAGLVGLAVRNDMGAWCGYVAVNPGHPWHGKYYDDIDAHAHGGLTYSEACQGHVCHIPEPGEPDNVWWVGFDCAHAGDLVPSLVAGMAAAASLWPPLDYTCDDVYKDLAYVTAEVEDLASQAASA